MICDNARAWACKTPNQFALKTRSDSATYGELAEMVRETARQVENLGLCRYEPIGLAFPNSTECVTLMLACEDRGHPSVLLGAAMKSSEMRYHIQNHGLHLVLAYHKLASQMEMAGGTKAGSIGAAIDCWSFEDRTVDCGFAAGDFICQITSGTGGTPKAVVRTARGVWREIEDTAQALNLSETDVVLTIPPIHHSYGLVGGTLMPLCFGATVVLLDGFFSAEVISIIEEARVSILFAVPFMYHILNESVQSRLIDFSSLRLCLSAGAPMSKAVASRFLKQTGKPVSQDYGSTETGLMCLNLDTSTHGCAAGLPLGDHEIGILAEDGAQLPVGETGEIWVKSGATARCYLYPKSLNDSAFNGEWFNTQDTGYIDPTGYLNITGRKSSMINVAGLKVDPAEVEKAISAVPGVEEVAVVGVDSGPSGQIVKATVATSGEVTEKDIIQYCRKHLADHKVPRIIRFVKELPKTATGKVLRKYLIEEVE